MVSTICFSEKKKETVDANANELEVVLCWNHKALTFCTLCANPSWWTAAQTIVATTLATIQTLAMLTAVHAICTNRAGNGAVFACPTRQTLTGT
jgi:hypothetical protein